MSVYHVALAGRVQRYSPIYYPDSHANSAIVPTGLRLTERPPCHTVAVRVVVSLHIYIYERDACMYAFTRAHAHTHTCTHMAAPRIDTFRHPDGSNGLSA